MPRFIFAFACFLFLTAGPAHAGWPEWLGFIHPVNRDAAAGGVEKGYTNRDLNLPDSDSSQTNTSQTNTLNLTLPKFDDPALIAPKKDSLIQKVENWINTNFHADRPPSEPSDPFGTDAQDRLSQSQGAAATTAVESKMPIVRQQSLKRLPQNSLAIANDTPPTSVSVVQPASHSIGAQPAHSPTIAASGPATAGRVISKPGSTVYLTATQALDKGIKLQNLRPLTAYESLDAIAHGVDPQSVKNLFAVESAAVRAAPPAESTVPVNRPYLGAGQQAIDRAFSASSVPTTTVNRPYLGAGQTAISNAFSSTASNGPSSSRPYLGVGQQAIDKAFSPAAGQNTSASRPYLGVGQKAIDKAFAPDGAAGKASLASAPPPSQPAPHHNFASYGVTRRDLAIVRKTPTITAPPPKSTDFASAPGKPPHAEQLKPKIASQPRRFRYQAARRYYQPAPSYGVNCAKLQMQFRQAVQNTGFMIDPNLYSSANMLDRYCGGAR